ncbi:unnamed protein product [Pleuronectes platessa]|uniref:Uncharacterized protein n=1 Tax=Pleuronectes platessa TaxID=8262 RepID=A0A9N7YKM7_PLEPL|nr:unnamed protein product [Pleuronectes platessa]
MEPEAGGCGGRSRESQAHERNRCGADAKTNQKLKEAETLSLNHSEAGLCARLILDDVSSPEHFALSRTRHKLQVDVQPVNQFIEQMRGLVQIRVVLMTSVEAADPGITWVWCENTFGFVDNAQRYVIRRHHHSPRSERVLVKNTSHSRTSSSSSSSSSSSGGLSDEKQLGSGSPAQSGTLASDHQDTSPQDPSPRNRTHGCCSVEHPLLELCAFNQNSPGPSSQMHSGPPLVGSARLRDFSSCSGFYCYLQGLEPEVVPKPKTQSPKTPKPKVQKAKVQKPEVPKPKVPKPKVQKPKVPKPKVPKPKSKNPKS